MGKIMFNGESYTGGTGDGGHAYSTAVLLWEGDWSTGSLTVNGISDWLIVGYETSDGLFGLHFYRNIKKRLRRLRKISRQ